MTFREGKEIRQVEAIEGSALFAGDKIVIDSDVTGDCFVFGSDVVINGIIEGDVIGAASKITINNEIRGNLRFLGEEVIINNNIERSASMVGIEGIRINPNSYIGRDVQMVSEEIVLDGDIRGGADVFSQSSFTVNGKIAKGVSFYGKESERGMIVSPNANIGGGIKYVGKIEGVEQGKNVFGSVEQIIEKSAEPPSLLERALSFLGGLLSITLLLYSVVFLGGRITHEVQDRMITDPLKSIGLGAISLFFLPVLCIILLISNYAGLVGFVCLLAWIATIIFSGIFSIIAAGEFISSKLFKSISGKIYYTSLVGLAFSSIIMMIPFLAFFMILFYIWWGTGGIILELLRLRKGDICIPAKSSPGKEDIAEDKKSMKKNKV
jgi:hypothetical protein